MASQPCRLAFFPLDPGELIARFCFHVHDESYPIENDLPGAIIVGTSSCHVNPGQVEISYDVAAGVLIITPVGAQSPTARMFIAAADDDGELVEADFEDDEVKDPA